MKMNLLEACRMCLAVDTRMYAITNTPFEDLYEKTTGRLFQSGDGKPVLACYVCHHLLTKWLIFTERSVRVDELLQQVLDQGEELTQTVVGSIGPVNLRSSLVFSSEYCINLPELLDVPVKQEKEIKAEMKCDEDDSLVEEAVDSTEDSHDFDDPLHAESDGTTKLREVKIEKVDIKREKSTKFLNTDSTVPSSTNEKENSTIQKSPESVLCKYCGIKKKECMHGQTKRCKICGKTFNHPSHLAIHMRTHTGVKPYNCQYCSKGFTQKGNLDKHVMLHTREKPYSCNECSKTFGQRHELMLHMGKKHNTKKRDKEENQKKVLHVAKKSHTCDLCGKLFTKNYTLQKHIRTHISEKETYNCDACGKTFVQKKNLQRHIVAHHERKKVDYKCEICNKFYTTKGVLKSHMLIHREAQYHCSQCGKSFVQKNSLKIHMISHTEDKIFTCNVCGNVYKHKSSLLQHMQTHDKTKSVCCDLCGKVFKSSRRLGEHLRMHSGFRRIRKVLPKKKVKTDKPGQASVHLP